MGNLIDNALHQAAEAVRVDGNLEIDGEHGHLAYAVCDDGVGISRAERDRLFRHFEKEASGLLGDDPGVGLGLTICSEIMRRMGGTIEIGDASLGGASVRLAVPLPIATGRSNVGGSIATPSAHAEIQAVA